MILNLFRCKEIKYLDLINFKHKEYLLIYEIYDTRKTFVNKYFKKLEYDYEGLINRYRIPDNNEEQVKF